ncbi:MAG: hypothetical protein Q9227_008907 [Pyrenula ochraceoflavens]
MRPGSRRPCPSSEEILEDHREPDDQDGWQRSSRRPKLFLELHTYRIKDGRKNEPQNRNGKLSELQLDKNKNCEFAQGSGVLRSLRPNLNADFDFSPSDFFSLRNGNGNYHTGDLTLRYRTVGNGSWAQGDTATIRSNSTSFNALGVATSLSPALPGASQYLNVTRTWSELEGDLTLQFTLSNTQSSAIEIGSLGMPIEFNNIFSTRMPTDTTQKCVLLDPFIGLHAGYVQVTRLTGTGPNLVITPLGNLTKLEAWRFLKEPYNRQLGYQVQTYEGNYEYQVYTQAYAEQEWNATTPWNPPTAVTIQPGQSISVGLRFSVAPSIETIEDTVSAAGLPTAVGLPGYVLPHDLEGKLYLNTSSSVSGITVTPADAIQIQSNGMVQGAWQEYTLQSSGDAFGRVRVDIAYGDGKTMSLHYWVSNPGPDALTSLGSFLTNDQYYTDTSDPFHRAPSVITYDRSVNDYVLQDNRTWIAGLSDEGGAGSFLAAGMKTAVSPDSSEVAKLEDFVNQVVWGYLQLKNGTTRYGVRKSLFFYQPNLVPGYQYSSDFNWTVNPGESWNQQAAYLLNRGYDYVHVSNLYWSLYNAGRTHPGILTQQNYTWYLLQAYETVMGNILDSLYAENLTAQATSFESTMRARQDAWSTQPNPYGSEMAWDSTGQEGVYYWSAYFNDSATADKTLASIRGYMPTIPHCLTLGPNKRGYNGNARRYWDFLYAGKLPRIERQIHHYGSGLNSLPLLENYRSTSDPSFYDLRVGYGGHQGPLSNLDAEGFGSMAFHSYADSLFWDSYSGDYGPNFVGHVLGAAAWLVQHPDFGWVGFGGNVQVSGGSGNGTGVVTMQPRDMVRKRVFVGGDVGVYVTVDAGTVAEVRYDLETGQVSVDIVGESGWDGDLVAVMKVEQSKASTAQIGVVSPELQTGRGGYLVPLPRGGNVTVVLGGS